MSRYTGKQFIITAIHTQYHSLAMKTIGRAMDSETFRKMDLRKRTHTLIGEHP